MPEEALVPNVSASPTRLLTDDELHLRAVGLVEQVWLSIDHANMPPGRRMGLWEELVSRVRSASHAPTLSRFAETLCRKLGVLNPHVDVVTILDALSPLDADAMLRLFRAEPLVMVCELRARRDEAKTAFELRQKLGIVSNKHDNSKRRK